LDRRLQLVLVDDHEHARRALAGRLAGHEQLAVAGQTADPLEAYALVRDHGPHVALIDPVREDGRGDEIVATLALLPGLQRPLIYVHLAFFDPDLWEQMRFAGADDVFLKQTDLHALASRLFIGVVQLLPRERWPGILGAS